MSVKQLKAALPALEDICLRSIQRLCEKNLHLSSRKMAARPLLIQVMKEKRLPFPISTGNGGKRTERM
jgi:hypothetical protein